MKLESIAPIVLVLAMLNCNRGSDREDVSNYQSAGWLIGRTEDLDAHTPVRFSAGFARHTSGLLVVKLDTSADRPLKTEPPFHHVLADSIVVRGLGRRERFARTCRLGTRPVDGQVVGVLPDSVPERWSRPRLAWSIDTAAARFRAMATDSVTCMLEPNPD
jgi:hypothetical protein